MPLAGVEYQIAESINAIVQLQRDRQTGKRMVSEIVALEGYDRRTSEFRFKELWRAPQVAACHAAD